MAGVEPARDGKLWIMPVLLELFAFPFAWISVQMLHDHEPWVNIAAYALTGIVLCVTGLVWAVFRKRISELWPWNRLRIARAELTRVLEDNAALRKTLPLAKPQHNVQCVGFQTISSADFDLAVLSFQNVPIPGQLLGKFEYARLRAIYYDDSTGQEIADLSPLQWWDQESGIPEITAQGADAVMASFFKPEGKWKASELIDSEDVWHQLHSVELLPGKYKIVAVLSGSMAAQIPPVEGILTLGVDGTSSFERTA